MNRRKIFIHLLFSSFTVIFAYFLSGVSMAAVVDPSLENACRSLGGQCSSSVSCASGWSPTSSVCTRVNPIIPCCIKKSSPCESAGYTCSRLRPGDNWIEQTLTCAEDELKCWEESSVTSSCNGQCVNPVPGCPTGTHLVAHQCNTGGNTICCENNITNDKCTPSGGTCGGDCGRCSICKLSGGVYQCVYSKDECVGCGGAADNEEKKFTDPLYNGPTIKNIESILVPLGKILYYGGLFIGMCFVVIAGYTLMTSEGNPQKTQEGQEQLTAAIIGIAFILLSSAIIRVIINLV